MAVNSRQYPHHKEFHSLPFHRPHPPSLSDHRSKPTPPPTHQPLTALPCCSTVLHCPIILSYRLVLHSAVLLASLTTGAQQGDRLLPPIIPAWSQQRRYGAERLGADSSVAHRILAEVEKSCPQQPLVDPPLQPVSPATAASRGIHPLWQTSPLLQRGIQTLAQNSYSKNPSYLTVVSNLRGFLHLPIGLYPRKCRRPTPVSTKLPTSKYHWLFQTVCLTRVGGGGAFPLAGGGEGTLVSRLFGPGVLSHRPSSRPLPAPRTQQGTGMLTCLVRRAAG